MALIKLGGLAQDVRGSLNGTTFSRNRGGAYVRSKVSPVQPITDFNTRSRSIFAAISQIWSGTLTDVQRAGWNALAAVQPFVNVFGDSIILSGIAFFQAYNRKLGEIGADYVLVAPSSTTVEDPGDVTVAFTETAGVPITCIVTVARTLLTNEKLYIFSTPPMLASRSIQRNDYRLVNSPLTGAWASAFDFVDAMIMRFPDRVFPLNTRGGFLVTVLNTVTGGYSSPVAVPYLVALEV